MIKLLLVIPGNKDPFSFPNLNSNLANSTTGGLVSAFLPVAFSIAGLVMFIWVAIGIFQYITAGGNKESLGKARAKITWALIGFLILIISFSLSLYIQGLARPQYIPVQSVNQNP